MSGSIQSEIDGHICTVTIENKGKRNAIDFSMVEELTATFEALEERDERTVVVVRGAGDKAFSSGFDLSIDRSDLPKERKQLWPRMTDTIEAYTYPVIAMVNGDTYGGAVELAAACDLRVGIEEARFGITPAKIGLVYGGRAINRIMRIIGPAKTKEMLFTANAIPANHAAEIGFLNYVVERDKLEKQTYGIAEDIAKNAPLSLRAMKEIIDTILEKGRLSEAEIKWIQQLRDQAFASEDHTEGVAAFEEGRQPEFQDQ
jgi:methylmalonyl-CoA decarboxylase